MSTSAELWMKRARRLQTEEEWRSWEFLSPLIKLLDQDRVSARKLHLFTAACVRRLLDSPYLGEHGWVVEALEQHADAKSALKEIRSVAVALREVRLLCTEVMGGMYWQASIDYPEEPATDPWRVAWGTAEATLIAAGRCVRVATGLLDDRPEQEHFSAEERTQCDLVRCIFGNPFRPTVFDPSWQTSDVTAISRGMYESRDFSAMAILADALQDAGCDDTTVLDHCRNTSHAHTRGCWVVDSILGKE